MFHYTYLRQPREDRVDALLIFLKLSPREAAPLLTGERAQRPRGAPVLLAVPSGCLCSGFFAQCVLLFFLGCTVCASVLLRVKTVCFFSD